MQAIDASTQRFQSTLRKLYGSVALVVVALISTSVGMSFYSLNLAQKQAATETHNLANSLVLTFDGLLDVIDITLLTCRDEIAVRIERGKPDAATINRYLQQQSQRVPSLFSLRATDELGNLIYGIEPNAQTYNVADREYFSESKNHPEEGMYVSKPILSRVNGQWNWLFSRPIIKSDGSFGGVVFASILTSEINQKLSNITLPKDSSISLRHKSMELIARPSYGSDNVIPTGSKKLSNTLIRALSLNAMEGTYISDDSGLDKVIKTYSYVASKKYGFVVIAAISREVALAAWYKQVMVVSVLVALFVAGAFMFVYFLRLSILRQVQDTGTIQLSRDALQKLNSELEERVQARTVELSLTLDNLRAAQKELVQSEKRAALGAIVIGMAHEINTPIGNAITLTSIVERNLTQLKNLLQNGKLSKSVLEAWVKESDDMIDLISRSVNRVAGLVSNFKKIAADNTAESKRVFDLRNVIDAAIVTVLFGLKNHAFMVDDQIPEGILCESYIGSIEEIIFNLVHNAALHGFHGRSHGTLTLTADFDDETVRLCVADNGVGMDSETLNRVFDPFFTTKLGRGGSGLGLTVCRQIAINILDGDLQATSILGAGSEFILTLSRHVSGKS